MLALLVALAKYLAACVPINRHIHLLIHKHTHTHTFMCVLADNTCLYVCACLCITIQSMSNTRAAFLCPNYVQFSQALQLTRVLGLVPTVELPSLCAHPLCQ